MPGLSSHFQWLRFQYLRVHRNITRSSNYSPNTIPFFQPSYMPYQGNTETQRQWNEQQCLPHQHAKQLSPVSSTEPVLLSHQYPYPAQVKLISLLSGKKNTNSIRNIGIFFSFLIPSAGSGLACSRRRNCQRAEKREQG